MTSSLKGRDYIETADWTVDELELALDVAADLKRRKRCGEPHRLLPDKTLFLLFFDNSTRTRNSMEAGITQLGGHAHFIEAHTSQIAHGESPKDTGIILSSYGHGIAIRHDLVPGEGNSYMRQIAKHATVPILNMQCDIDHPMQILADLMTIRELFGRDLRGRKIAVTWAYASSYTKPMSVPQGLITLMPRFGLDVVLAHPPEYRLMDHPMKLAAKFAEEAGVRFEVTHSMEEAVRDADVVYAKSWGAEHLFGKREEAQALADRYKGWICDSKLMGLAEKRAVYMHCLPADRGREVTDEVLDGPQSVVYQEAENRLHTAKALMALTM